MDFPGVSGKESACQPGDMGLIPELERSPGKGNDNPFQYSCLENPMDRGTWWATLHGAQRVGHSFTTEYTHISVCIIHFAVYLKTT